MDEMQWKIWLREHSPEVLETIGLSREDRILDFGCGMGHYTFPAARCASHGRVYALDRDADCLRTVARQGEQANLDNIETLNSEDLCTDLPGGSIDMVLLFDVMHAVQDWNALLSEMHRVVRSGGLLSVHPMHVCNDEVHASMGEAGFRLVSECYDGHLLVFRRVP